MINFSGVTNPADYDRLYAFMHRISNAKIHAAGENAEWEDWKVVMGQHVPVVPL